METLLKDLLKAVRQHENKAEQSAELLTQVNELSQELIALISGDQQPTAERDEATVALERKKASRKLERLNSYEHNNELYLLADRAISELSRLQATLNVQFNSDTDDAEPCEAEEESVEAA